MGRGGSATQSIVVEAGAYGHLLVLYCGITLESPAFSYFQFQRICFQEDSDDTEWVRNVWEFVMCPRRSVGRLTTMKERLQ